MSENEQPKSGDVIHAETKALIEDKTKSESNTVSIDLFYAPEEQIRLEVSAVLGIQLGSLLMNNSEIAYALHQQQLFVQGPLVPRVLKPMFKQELDPKIIWSLVFDKSLENYGFSCKRNSQVETCNGPDNTGSSVVTIEKKPHNLKKMTIENSRFKFVWIYKSIKKHNMSYNETFVLKKPEEYRLITIK